MNPDDLTPHHLSRLLSGMQANDGHDLADELVSYAFGDLSGDDNVEIEAHLATCQSCRHELERIREFAQTLNRRESQVAVDGAWNAFRQAVDGRRRLSAFLSALSQLGWPLERMTSRRVAQASKETARIAVADGHLVGLLTWEFSQDTDGQLHARITATDASLTPLLEGATITLATDPAIESRLMTTGQGSAVEFTVPPTEWRRLQSEAGRPVIRRIVLADGTELTLESHDRALEG